MMPNDIGSPFLNPNPMVIRHELGGPDVYHDVRTDYSRENLTLSSLVVVLRGNKELLNSGSGQVLSPNPNGRVFLFISAHGHDCRVIIGKDLLARGCLYEILKQNYISERYQSMVMYVYVYYS
ncbi:putative legumain protein [Helianthus anomalus]